MQHKFIIFLIALTTFLPQKSFAQIQKCRVYFNHKSAKNFDAKSYFDAKAIERRIRQELPLYDWYDLPVDAEYLQAMEGNSERLIMHSRWLNAAVVLANPEQIEKIKAFSFVKEVEISAPQTVSIAGTLDSTDSNQNEVLANQISRMGSASMEAKQLNGKGIRVAIFDVGFSGADNHKAFEHLRTNGRILKTWDFVKNEENVYKGGWHGTAVWSCIGGKINNQWSGLAWDAEFLLARTEIGTREPFSEEENWVAAAEWADKNGADIINSSLGYTDTRYFPEQMDGKKSFISRGANMAAKKGMLVVNAAGNEGDGKWKIIGAPADADSVLSVGGVEPCCDYKISFSSYGPTADKRLKPNVAAQGRALCAVANGTNTVDGTSFASPLMAGFAACMWQANRDLKNMEMFKALEQSGHLYPYYDYAHGYGIPHVDRFKKDRQIENQFVIENDPSGLEMSVKINEESFDPGAEEGKQLLYYAIVRPSGLIESYYVLHVTERIPLRVNVNAYSKGNLLRVNYKGQTLESEFK